MVGRHLPLGFRTGYIGAEYVVLQARMTPFSSMESTNYYTASYDAIGILNWCTNVSGTFGFVGMHTVWMLVRPQSRESFAKESLQNLFESLAIHFIVKGICLTQDLLNLYVEPSVWFLCSGVI